MDLTENIIIAKLLMYQLMNRRSSVGNSQSFLFIFTYLFSNYLHNLNFENLNFFNLNFKLHIFFAYIHLFDF